MAIKTPPPDFSFEAQSGYPARLVAGCDEVGRGCLAGPVVAAAVIPGEWNPSLENRPEWMAWVTDSKAISAERREYLVPHIQAWARAYCVAQASVEEIDRINIFHASFLAMERAWRGLALSPEHLLIDGNHVPKAWRPFGTAVVKGDSKSFSIACASILAKVDRDRQLVELEQQWPGYGFATHKGYGTPAHLEALRRLGPTVWHRQSFAPVAQLTLGV
jgi:ribonuclease HII